MENSGKTAYNQRKQSKEKNKTEGKCKEFSQEELRQTSILFDVQNFLDAYSSLPHLSK